MLFLLTKDFSSSIESCNSDSCEAIWFELMLELNTDDFTLMSSWMGESGFQLDWTDRAFKARPAFPDELSSKPVSTGRPSRCRSSEIVLATIQPGSLQGSFRPVLPVPSS